MITEILYRCPECGAFKWLEQGRCGHCHATVQVLSRNAVAVNGEVGSVAFWYEKVRGFALPAGDDGPILASGRIRLSREVRRGCFKGLAGVHAICYGRQPVAEGRLALYANRLLFKGASSETVIPFERVSAVTIESNTVVVDDTDGPALFFDFREESGKQWEDCLQAAVARYHHPRKIAEFCPRIRFAGNSGKTTRGTSTRQPFLMATGNGYGSGLPAAGILLKVLAKHLLQAVLDIRLKGLAHLPASGAAILAANHVSLVDGILLGACLPRPVHFMTKNSQFNHALLRSILRKGGAFPVMRYRTDPVAVRNALRILERGNVLGVFPEGERSWDGRRLPFKRGTLRLVLAAGQPVVPVGISGIYELMPRWTSSLKRVPVRINIGRPLKFPMVPPAAQTENDIRRIDNRLREAITDLARAKGGAG